MFQWGMLTPTLLDVATILRQSAGGKEVHARLDFSAKYLVYEHNPVSAVVLSYNAQISGEVTDVEHHAFLMYFFNKYFYNTNSFQVVKEERPFIRLLLSNQGVS